MNLSNIVFHIVRPTEHSPPGGEKKNDVIAKAYDGAVSVRLHSEELKAMAKDPNRELFKIRPAALEDISTLEVLIPESVRTLQAGSYTPEQIKGALGTVFGVDTQLIKDRTYFVAEIDAKIVACGGWSRRRTLFGSDSVAGKDDQWLDPAAEPARIRAFFVHPAWARRGIGSAIMRRCEEAAREMGFSRLELAATLVGVPLYRAHGFESLEQIDVPLSNGQTLPVVRMTKRIARKDAGTKPK
jgi:GNAT superfamily N-acetyltransferase